MKQNTFKSFQQICISGIHRLRFICIFFAAVLTFSCNNKSDKKSTGSDTDTTQNKPEGPGTLSITFHKYRLEKSQIALLGNKKIVLYPQFDDFQDPKEMQIWFTHFNTIGPVAGSIQCKSLTNDPAATFDASNIGLTNNELVFSDYQWGNFEYLILEPTRIGDKLGFNITAFTSNGGATDPPVEVTLPQAARFSKPSPPAPPGFIPSDK